MGSSPLYGFVLLVYNAIESHTEVAYSNMDCAKMRYAFSLSFVELISRLHLRNPSVLFAFQAVMMSMWLSQVAFLCMVMLRHFAGVTVVSICPWSL